jgi:hypothetical protein
MSSEISDDSPSASDAGDDLLEQLEEELDRLRNALAAERRATRTLVEERDAIEFRVRQHEILRPGALEPAPPPAYTPADQIIQQLRQEIVTLRKSNLTDKIIQELRLEIVKLQESSLEQQTRFERNREIIAQELVNLWVLLAVLAVGLAMIFRLEVLYNCTIVTRS